MGTSAAIDLELEDLLPSHGMPSAPCILKLRTTHHELARLLACGFKDVDISRVTGYSQSRISILKRDPMFSQLVDEYMARRDEFAVDFSARLRQISATSLEMLQERMEDEPKAFTPRDLRQLAEMALDRTGHGKTMTVNNVNVTKQTLDEIKASIEKAHKGRVIPRDQRLDSCGEVGEQAGELALPSPPEGSEGEGD